MNIYEAIQKTKEKNKGALLLFSFLQKTLVFLVISLQS